MRILIGGVCLVVLAFSVAGLTSANNKKQDGQNVSPKQIVEEFSAEQKKLFELHNKERTSRGYVALEMDKDLCAYAQKHAEYMAEKNRLSHSSMSELSKVKGKGAVGENIAWGQESEESTVSSWMWSPGHRWNILGTSYKKAGFGAVKDKNGRYYWCAVFSS